jgi:hypothetical protein
MITRRAGATLMNDRSAACEPAVDLKAALAAPCMLDQPLVRTAIPDHIDLLAGLVEHVEGKGFANPTLPVSTLHHRVSQEDRRTVIPVLNRISARVSVSSPKLVEAYQQLVRYLARDVLCEDVLFEANPYLRFYFPGFTLDGYRSADGRAVSYHSDTLFGDSFDQINCWVPFGRAAGCNALQCSSLESSTRVLLRHAMELDYQYARYTESRNLFFKRLCDDPVRLAEVERHMSPVEVDYGEVLLFDPRLVHGTLDNTTDETRVSIDFRLLPLSAYWRSKLSRRPLPRIAQRLRGHYWHEQSAFELAS